MPKEKRLVPIQEPWGTRQNDRPESMTRGVPNRKLSANINCNAGVRADFLTSQESRGAE